MSISSFPIRTKNVTSLDTVSTAQGSGKLIIVSGTGAYLIGPTDFINSIYPSGVNAINNKTGLLNLTGSGNITVFVNNQTLTISGNTGAYSNFVTPSQTGILTGQFYPLTGNPSGFGSVRVTGTTLFNPNFTGAGNVSVTTGANNLVIVSGNTGAYTNFITPSQTGLLTGQFYPLYNNPSGYVTSTSGVVTMQGGATILNGQLLIGASGANVFQLGNLTGSTGILIISGSGSLGISIDTSKVITGLIGGTGIYIANNSGGLLTLNTTGLSLTAGVTSLNSLTGSLSLSGFGNITVTTGSGVINISGNTGAYTNFVTSLQTGLLTGEFYPLNSNPAGYITGIAPANTTSGCAFTSLITSGTNSQFISFPFNFPVIPTVNVTTEITTGNNLYTCNISGISSSGFYALYSNFIAESGQRLNVLAYSGSGVLTSVLTVSDWQYRNISGTQINPITIIDWRSGSYFYKTLTGSTTFIFTGHNDAQTINIKTISTGNFFITWPTGVKWPNSSFQNFSGTSGSVATGRSDLWGFTKINSAIHGNYLAGYYE